MLHRLHLSLQNGASIRYLHSKNSCAKITQLLLESIEQDNRIECLQLTSDGNLFKASFKGVHVADATVSFIPLLIAPT